MKYIVKRKDETLDEIVSKNYGSSFGYLELVLKANPFLYTQGVYLKVGLAIELPELKKEAQSRIALWN
ncbi:MAG: tail protein X [Alphaproteobacteria bacterium]|jgi:phage tail protein X|nr:tail protein X [Alphaproteobacteria bacterium]